MSVNITHKSMRDEFILYLFNIFFKICMYDIFLQIKNGTVPEYFKDMFTGNENVLSRHTNALPIQ